MQKSFPVKAGQEWKENPERTAPGDRKPLFTGYTGKEGIFFCGLPGGDAPCPGYFPRTSESAFSWARMIRSQNASNAGSGT